MEPFLPVIVEHVFVVHDGNIEELQSSAESALLLQHVFNVSNRLARIGSG